MSIICIARVTHRPANQKKQIEKGEPKGHHPFFGVWKSSQVSSFYHRICEFMLTCTICAYFPQLWPASICLVASFWHLSSNCYLTCPVDTFSPFCPFAGLASFRAVLTSGCPNTTLLQRARPEKKKKTEEKNDTHTKKQKTKNDPPPGSHPRTARGRGSPRANRSEGPRVALAAPVVLAVARHGLAERGARPRRRAGEGRERS